MESTYSSEAKAGERWRCACGHEHVAARPLFMSRAEAAAYLGGVSTKTIDRLAAARKIEKEAVEGRSMLVVASLDAYANRNHGRDGELASTARYENPKLDEALRKTARALAAIRKGEGS